jgi:hypothetical protein
MPKAIFDPSKPTRWNTIYWKSVEHRVTRLQYRISKANKKADHRMVRNLQRLLTFSLSNYLIVIKKIIGKNPKTGVKENLRKKLKTSQGNRIPTPSTRVKTALTNSELYTVYTISQCIKQQEEISKILSNSNPHPLVLEIPKKLPLSQTWSRKEVWLKENLKRTSLCSISKLTSTITKHILNRVENPPKDQLDTKNRNQNFNTIQQYNHVALNPNNETSIVNPHQVIEKINILILKENLKKYKSYLKTIIKLSSDPISIIQKLNALAFTWSDDNKNSVRFQRKVPEIKQYIWDRLWHWAQKRHSSKGKPWIFHKYWKKINNSWKFTYVNKKKIYALYP